MGKKKTGRLEEAKKILEMKTLLIEIINWWLNKRLDITEKEISELEGEELRQLPWKLKKIN